LSRWPHPPINREPEAAGLEKVEAEEFDRLQAEARARHAALEQETEAEREEQSRREVLDRVWREQEDYSRAVSDIRDASRRRRLLVIAAAGVAAAAVVAAVLYSQWPAQGDIIATISEAEALRIASEARKRREEEARARLAAEAAARLAEVKREAKAEPAAEPVEDAAARARAEEAAKQAAADKAAAEKERVLALKAKDEERRAAELAAKAQAQAMVRAEERARAVAAVKEAPRAALRPGLGTVFQDCAECPRMVVVPSGEFTMGSPAAEGERAVDEGPQRQVSIAQPFALGRSEVTVAEFRRFVEESGYRTEAERDTRAQGCSGFIYADPAARNPAQPFTSWRSPGLAQAQADPHPVLCVSWNDARAYAQWLSKKTGRRYRLPTEAEWEYAARAGSAGARHWGDDPVQACRFANVADQSRFQTWSFGQKHDCTDGHYFTAPAGGYAPNRFGLYDMLGNVWEWTEDCWNASYAGAPTDGSAWLKGDCGQRILRGGSWSTVPRFARSAARHKNPVDFRDNLTGFRVARSLD
jgi:formylglycine-generating enzyme required for sulfatase activity